MRPLDPISLACLISVSNTGTIAGAAQERHLAASAVSKRLQDMEIRLGIELIERGARGVTLTDAGNLLVKHATHILDLYDHIEAEIENLKNGEAGDIRIVAITSALGGSLAADLAAFENAYPQTRLRLREGWQLNMIELVKRGVADLGVMADRALPSMFQTYPYVDDPIWVVAKKGHQLLKGRDSDERIPFRVAVQHGVILMKGSSAVDLAALRAEQESDEHTRYIEVTRYESLRRLVESGMGVSFIRRSAVVPYMVSHEIDGRPLDDEWAQHGLVIAHRRDADLSPATQRLLEHLRQCAEKHRGA